jgi:hypothetical protein
MVPRKNGASLKRELYRVKRQLVQSIDHRTTPGVVQREA